MGNPVHTKRDIIEWTLQRLNGTAGPEQFEQLCRQMDSDPALLETYVEFMILYAELVHPGNEIDPTVFQPEQQDLSLLDPGLWQQLSREETDAPAVAIQPEPEKPAPLRVSQYQKPELPIQKSSKSNLLFSLLSTAAALLFILYVWTHPRHIPQDVAMVTDTYQARWNDGQTIRKGTRLFDDKNPLHLLAGVVKVKFDSGVKVVIEGPAIFSLDSDHKMNLSVGKLYTQVPPPATGFRIRTPGCSIIDLGTEFGINVSDQGKTNIQMFKGKASLVPFSQKDTLSGKILSEGQANHVMLTGDIQDVAFEKYAFVQDFDSEKQILWNGQNLSLADMVTGGNGLKHDNQNVGINPQTGELVFGNREDTEREPIEAHYVEVPQIPYVDGVFVPNGENGPVQLTSAGHTYDGFRDTNGMFYMPIGSYSEIMMKKDAQKKQALTRQALQLKGYPQTTCVNLSLHANSGITFDLQAIRQAMPFVQIKQFTSDYGVAYNQERLYNVDADFYVFVDGDLRMAKQDMLDTDKPGHLEIPLAQTDRFLTLVCTESEKNYADWSLFVNPVLELE